MPSGSRDFSSKLSPASLNWFGEEKLPWVLRQTFYEVSIKTQHRPTVTFKEAICTVVENREKKVTKQST